MTGAVFALPDLGEGLHEAEIVAWLVSAGDHVVADQPLVSVETDKAVVEIPSPRAGRIARLRAEPGARIAVGAPLVEFEEGAHADVGAVVGEIAPVPAAPPPPPPAKAAARAAPASPAARALARELGVDLAAVRPSGAHGEITRADVEQAARAPAAAPAGDWQPLAGVRRAMAAKMARSGAAVVPATVTGEADVEAWAPDADATLRLVRAVAAACAAAPALNAWYDGARNARLLHRTVNLGLAVDTADGLFVPVIADIGRRPVDELRREIAARKAEVRERRIAPAALRGQTITLSNFGTLGGRFASLVIVPPQVAILGAGRIAPRVVAVEGRPAVHRVLPLSLTFDHRAVTGGEAARFLAAAIADLEKAD